MIDGIYSIKEKTNLKLKTFFNPCEGTNDNALRVSKWNELYNYIGNELNVDLKGLKSFSIGNFPSEVSYDNFDHDDINKKIEKLCLEERVKLLKKIYIHALSLNLKGIGCGLDIGISTKNGIEFLDTFYE